MDSTRALRSTLVMVITFTAFTGGTATIASADQDGSSIIHQGSWRAEAPQVRQRVWTTAAKPRHRAHRRTPGKNKDIALGLVVQRAWSYREFRCLDSLWTRESNWNHRAYNSSSGAYGIPQALPGGKMRGAGRDWRSNPATQIRWGLKYIKGRYGRPCGAWGHFRSHNWY